jgi:phosphoacetylglucosamine mutase
MPVYTDDRCISFDGDADRVIFFTRKGHDQFIVLDGDRISVLAATVLKIICEAADVDLKIGVVQTAYANGSSTRYIREVLQLPLLFTKTGVKYLHASAKKFDIGIYFESNGHGTVLFSPHAIDTIHSRAEER